MYHFLQQELRMLKELHLAEERARRRELAKAKPEPGTNTERQPREDVSRDLPARPKS